jgi:hypothetical protein
MYTVRVIGDNSFGDNSVGVTVRDRFYPCKSLDSVMIESGSMGRKVGSSVFGGCDSLLRIPIFADF